MFGNCVVLPLLFQGYAISGLAGAVYHWCGYGYLPLILVSADYSLRKRRYVTLSLTSFVLLDFFWRHLVRMESFAILKVSGCVQLLAFHVIVIMLVAVSEDYDNTEDPDGDAELHGEVAGSGGFAEGPDEGTEVVGGEKK